MLTPSLQLALDLALKGTAVLVLAFLAHRWIGNRRGVVTRSALWNAALVTLAVLPLVTLAVPRWQIPCLPEFSAPAELVGATEMQSNHTSGSLHTRRGTGAVPVCVIAEPASATRATPARPWSWPAMIIGLYAAGVAVLLLRLVGGLHTLRRIRGLARPLDDSYWQGLLNHAARQVGTSPNVPIAFSDRINVPVTIGCLHPTVLLPDYVVHGMQRSDHHAILLHELTHVRRRDFAWQLLHQVILALYWPHPLMWFAGRLIDTARERVCDEVCVHHLGDTIGYRRTLLDVASRLVGRPRLAAGLTMARRGGLQARLQGLRDSRGFAQCAPHWPQRVLLGTIVLAGTIGIAPLQLTAAVQPPDRMQTVRVAHELLDSYADVDPRTLPPAELASVYLAALTARDTEQLELMTSGRLAQRSPAEWRTAADTLVAESALDENFPTLLDAAQHAEFTALAPVLPDDADTRLVLVIRECPWQRWSVVAIATAPAQQPVGQTLDRGLDWFHHELSERTPETWLDVPELQP
jgi:beta-lactamase regulating signal transducer with metallopeptidase domain